MQAEPTFCGRKSAGTGASQQVLRVSPRFSPERGCPEPCVHQVRAEPGNSRLARTPAAFSPGSPRTRFWVLRSRDYAANTSATAIWTIAGHTADICRCLEIYNCFFRRRHIAVQDNRTPVFRIKTLKSSAKTLSVLLLLILISGAAGRALLQAEDPSDRAATVRAEAGWFGRSLAIEIDLDGAVPFRVFTVANPPRLVVDLSAPAAATESGALPRQIQDLQAITLPDGWERLVFTLAAPFEVSRAELFDSGSGKLVRVRLKRSSPAEFARFSGVPYGAWPIAGHTTAADGLVVAIDAGHGGIDPGAVHGDIREKDIVLAFAEALRQHLSKLEGVSVAMLRDKDRFIGLADRVAGARAAGADLLISLHTNADRDPDVSGAIAFTRAERGTSRTAAARALLENAADDRAGLGDLGAEDPVLSALSDLARRETDARSQELARAIIGALREGDTGSVSGRAPLQAANFMVLRAPDIPSILLEIGFLSNPADREAMLSPEWRDRTASDVARGILTWAARDAAAGR